MNRSFFALFVALLIHSLFLVLYLYLSSITPKIQKTTPHEKKIKIALKELVKPKKQPKKDNTGNIKKKLIKKVKVAPAMPKGKQLKKLVKKKTIVFKPKKEPLQPKLNPKPKQQKPVVEKIKPLPPVKEYIPFKEPVKKQKIEKVQKQENIPGMDWLMEDKSQEITTQEKEKTSNGASAGKNIQELYGSEFGKLSAGQQKYILNNQEIMRRITQEVLNRQASVSNINNINVNRSNIVEFYLHPNGNMSDFRFLEKSGYFILDDITKSTIEYAYAKYPRPSEKTLIRYNVFYNLRY